MRIPLPMKLIPILMLVVTSGPVSASGFQLLEQNASGIGTAYAGSAVIGDNASTVFFNPAAMTRLQAREISAGMTGVKPTFRFHDQGSQVGALSGQGNGGDAGDWAALPNFYTTFAVNRDIYLGLGISAPFGLKTEYDRHWLGAAQSSRFEVKTININPSLAYRVNDHLSLGFGLNWQKLEAKYDRQVSIAPGFSQVKSALEIDDGAWGWNIGAMWTHSPSSRIGLSYRSRVEYRATGDAKLKSDGSASGQTAANLLIASGGQSRVRADIDMPDSLTLSVAQKLSERWEMFGDLSCTAWSSIPKVDIIRTSGPLNGRIAQTLDTDFRDAWRIAWGASYQYNPAWKIRFGMAYDQTPVKRASTRMVSLPDNDRVWFSLGTQWTPDKNSRLDFGLAYLYVRDDKIDNDQRHASPVSNRGRVSGDYNGHIWLIGGQYSLAF